MLYVIIYTVNVLHQYLRTSAVIFIDKLQSGLTSPPIPGDKKKVKINSKPLLIYYDS